MIFITKNFPITGNNRNFAADFSSVSLRVALPVNADSRILISKTVRTAPHSYFVRLFNL